MITTCTPSRLQERKPPQSTSDAPHEDLPAVAALAPNAAEADRSRAYFMAASRVLLHPRCVNCHPHNDSPRQRDGQMHEPPVTRGNNDEGAPALECSSCHQVSNQSHTHIPGAPNWHLAPKSMAWQGKTLGEICQQLKDPARNGNKTLAQIVEHSAHDPLVAWGWNPGADRQPAPGSQEAFGALMAAWADTGAECP